MAFGEWDVDRLLADMPMSTFLAWKDYWEIDGPTQERADLRTAIIAWLIANLFRGKSRPTKIEKYMASHYMQTGSKAKRPQSAAQMKSTLMAFTQAYNASQKQRRGRIRG